MSNKRINSPLCNKEVEKVAMQEKFITVRQIIKDHVPVGKSTWWQWVKIGKAPKSIKLGSKTTVWRLSDIQKFMESFTQEGA